MQQRAPAEAPALPALPASHVMRAAVVEEAPDLALLLGGVYPAETWEPDATAEELFHDRSVITTLVVAMEDRLLATASLQIRDDHPACGWIRWVGTEADSRRRGFARVLVTSLLSEAARAGCKEVRLHTESDRLAAISLYAQLGFEPFVETAEERELWAQLLSAALACRAATAAR